MRGKSIVHIHVISEILMLCFPSGGAGNGNNGDGNGNGGNNNGNNGNGNGNGNGNNGNGDNNGGGKGNDGDNNTTPPPPSNTSSAAPPSATSSPATGGGSGSGLQLQNGKDAQDLNAKFQTLSASSPCDAGENACVGDAFAQCVNGEFVITNCAGGLVCAALPLVNAPGTSITCTTQQDAIDRITRTGATGGLTGN